MLELVSDHDAPVTPVIVTLVSVTPVALTQVPKHQSESMDQSQSVQSMLLIALGAIPLLTALSVGVSQK
eukprot:3657453-Amphidinium_carterae.1